MGVVTVLRRWSVAGEAWGRALAGRPGVARVLRPAMLGLKIAVPLALLAWIGVKLHALGLAALVERLPRAPSFYLVFAVMFFVQPVGDTLVFRRLWPEVAKPGLAEMLRKRFFSSTLVDYSGEGYLYGWARRRLPGQDLFVLHTLKDSAVLSASVSLAVLIATAVGVVGFGDVTVPREWVLPFVALVAITAVPLSAYLLVAWRVTVVSARDLRFVFAVHLVRAVAANGLLVVLWACALPEAPTSALVELLTLRLLVSRLPVFGNKDVVLLGTGLGLGAAIDLPQAGVAAMLVTAVACELLANLVLVGVPMLMEGLADARTSVRDARASGSRD